MKRFSTDRTLERRIVLSRREQYTGHQSFCAAADANIITFFGDRGLCRMEKLETILHAEDTSRRAVDNARVRARELLKEARTEAELITLAADRETALRVTETRSRLLHSAKVAVAAIESEAEAELDQVVRQAQSRFDRTVEAVADELAR